jgi:hypothetical protein
MEIHPKIRDRFETATRDVQDMLIPLDQIDYGQAGDIIGRYTSAILPNFVPWVTAALVSARSPRARDAAHENLEEEIGENHQGMLYDFASDADALPTSQDGLTVAPAVSRIRENVAEMVGLYNVSLGAFLENTSAAFIPYLERLAVIRGSDNFVYTRAHGEADIEHAQQFLRAVQHEYGEGYAFADGTVENAIRDGNLLLDVIFNPEGGSSE